MRNRALVLGPGDSGLCLWVPFRLAACIPRLLVRVSWLVLRCLGSGSVPGPLPATSSVIAPFRSARLLLCPTSMQGNPYIVNRAMSRINARIRVGSERRVPRGGVAYIRLCPRPVSNLFEELRITRAYKTDRRM